MGAKKKEKKSYFDPVDPKVNFPEEEEKLLKYWYDSGVVNKYRQKNDSSNKYFSFIDGPITANNPMGVHHAWGRTYKDLWQRYKTLQGYKQRYQNGFDCQGLWVEVEVEKELGLKSKQDIENLVPGDKEKSIEKFVDLCKARVKKYAGVQTEQSKRLGYFMDWDNSYFTMSDENNYMIWHFLRVCHDNGWVYKGFESVPWCPRCQTAISQHEMLTEDYKEVTHDSIYFALPLVENKGEYLLVWTTTPWTLPANIAVAVDKNLEYSLVDIEGKKYWLASEAIARLLAGVDHKVIKVQKGDKLAGLHYKWAFDDLPAAREAAKNNKFHTVVETDDRIMPITTTEGTGMVHTAVSAGTEDYQLGKKLGLPMIPVIDDEANYLDGLGDFTGKNAKEDPWVILGHLKNLDKENGTNWIYKIQKYKHRYPGCWRCKAELVWKVTDEWYIAMDKKDESGKTFRERMIKVAKKINWLPDFGLKRELDWLNNMHDWLISKKNRYWGLALPIWVCDKCEAFEVIGSKEELEKRSSSGFEKLKNKSPHKPQVDAVKIKCKCGGEMSRVDDVGNPWLDAGIVAYSTISKDNKSKPLYLADKKEWKNWVPADFITESFPGQFKNWFYSLIAMSTVLEDIPPTKTIMGYSSVLAEDGRAMHKSWGNAIEFNEGAKKIGVDVMRWMFVRQSITDNILFGYGVADETRRRFHLKLWNIYNFFVTFANLDGWKPRKDSRLKIQDSGLTPLDKWILSRLENVLDIVEKSMDNYDAKTASEAIEAFVDDLSNWYIRRSRDRVGPAADSDTDKEAFYNTSYFVIVNLTMILAPFNPFMSDLMYKNLTNEESVHLSNWPKIENYYDKKLENQMVLAREVCELAHSIRKASGIPLRQPLSEAKIKSPEILEDLDYLITSEINVQGLSWSNGPSLDVKLDTKITPELEEEARTRELIRNVQKERKNIGVSLSDKVMVTSEWLPVDKENLNWVKTKTLASELEQGKTFKVIKASK